MTISQLVRVPQSCTEQLQHPEINGANPRTASITTLIPFGYANFDLITGRAVTRAASFGLAETSRGRALRGSGAACASIALNLSAYQRITLSFWLYWDAFASDDDLAMEFSPNYNTGGGFLIDPNSGAPAIGYFQVGTGGTSAGSSRYFTRPSAAAWHHYMLVLDKAAASSGGVTAAYVDGSAVSLTTASTGGTTANFPNSTLYLFSRNNTGLFGNGSLLNLVIRGGYTGTADDALAEYTDPWGLFKAPQAPEIWVPVSAPSSGTTIAVPQGSLTLTGNAPTVVATANQRIAVPAGALTLTGNAPTVTTTANQLITIPAGTLTLTGYAPTVIGGESVPDVAQNRGVPGRWYTLHKGREVYGSREEIEGLLRQMARDHAEEDERTESLGEQPEKRRIRVVQPGRAQIKPAPKAEATQVSLPVSVAEQTGYSPADAQAIYAAAYRNHRRREEVAARKLAAAQRIEAEEREAIAQALGALTKRLAAKPATMDDLRALEARILRKLKQ